MEMNRREALKTLGAAVGAAFVPGRASAQGGEISVGSLLDGTGPINIYGLPMIDSTKFAVDDINARGGVLGRKLRMAHVVVVGFAEIKHHLPRRGKWCFISAKPTTTTCAILFPMRGPAAVK